MPSKSSADAASPSAAALGVRKSLADAASPSAAALGVRVRELEKFKMRRSSSVPANSTNSVFKRVASQLPPSLNFRGELLDADAVARVASSAEREKTPAALDLRSASFLSDEAVCQLAAVLARGLLARVDLRRCSGLTADARATLERAADKGGARLVASSADEAAPAPPAAKAPSPATPPSPSAAAAAAAPVRRPALPAEARTGRPGTARPAATAEEEEPARRIKRKAPTPVPPPSQVRMRSTVSMPNLRARPASAPCSRRLRRATSRLPNHGVAG